MQSLELKIPPPAIALIVAIAMLGVSSITSQFHVSSILREIAVLVFAVAGLGFSVGGVLAFRQARTTLNPLAPEGASSLVTSGVYRLTRNPMYLGLSLVLLAWAFFLYAPIAFLGPVLFVLYITRFQIVPEERVLAKLFGPAFVEYQTKVRRWI